MAEVLLTLALAFLAVAIFAYLILSIDTSLRTGRNGELIDPSIRNVRKKEDISQTASGIQCKLAPRVEEQVTMSNDSTHSNKSQGENLAKRLDYDRPLASAPFRNGLVTQIQELSNLHQSGILSDTEFAKAKAILLGESIGAPATSVLPTQSTIPAPHLVQQTLSSPENVNRVPIAISKEPLAIRCATCLAETLMPASTYDSIHCPYCNSLLFVVNEGTSYFPKGVAPAWKQSWGVFLKFAGLAIAGILFMYGAFGLKKGTDVRGFDFTEGVVEAVTNPLTWVCIILGIVWTRGVFTCGEFNESHLQWRLQKGKSH